MFLQLSGINAVAYYATSVSLMPKLSVVILAMACFSKRHNVLTEYGNQIFENELHYPPEQAGILAAASQICLALGSIVCSFSVDRFGRRKLMMLSASLMTICFACLAGLTSDPDNKASLKAAVFFIFFFYFVYTLGFLGIPFLYASEVAPVHLRAGVCGISTAASWLFNFLVVEVTPVAFNNIGGKYFIVFACINLVCVPIVYLFYPETAGRSLEEIDQVFVASKSVFDPVKIARRPPSDVVAPALDEQLKHTNEKNSDDREATAEKPSSDHARG
jgi:MFS family permease